MPMTATLVLNPGSGGGQVQGAVRAAAERRGVEVREVGPGADPAALAASSETEVIAVGGGDGTISAVAAVAVRRDVPLLVVPCGTRNHFAADIGLAGVDAAAMLGALDGGPETRVDVGSVNGRVFLNNVSVGFYSSIVRDPQYRTNRVGVSLRYARRALVGGGESLRVSCSAGPRVTLPEHPLTILVSNNAYTPGIAPGVALRARMDEGALWFHVLGVDGHRGPVLWRVARTAVHLLTGRTQVAAWPATEQRLRFDRPRVTVGVDGEAVDLDAPLEFRVLPGALRLLGTGTPAPGETTLRLPT